MNDTKKVSVNCVCHSQSTTSKIMKFVVKKVVYCVDHWLLHWQKYLLAIHTGPWSEEVLDKRIQSSSSSA